MNNEYGWPTSRTLSNFCSYITDLLTYDRSLIVCNIILTVILDIDHKKYL